MSLIGDNRLLIFGGHDGERMLNDLYILDTETLVWSRILVHGGLGAPRPAPRAGHTASLVGSTVVVFGGGDGERLLNDCWLLTLIDMDDDDSNSGGDNDDAKLSPTRAQRHESNGSGLAADRPNGVAKSPLTQDTTTAATATTTTAEATTTTTSSNGK